MVLIALLRDGLPEKGIRLKFFLQWGPGLTMATRLKAESISKPILAAPEVSKQLPTQVPSWPNAP